MSDQDLSYDSSCDSDHDSCHARFGDDSSQDSFGDTVGKSSGSSGSSRSSRAREVVIFKPSLEELLTRNKDETRRTMRAFQIVIGDHGDRSMLSGLYSFVGLRNS
jgi:hypothetical protein